MKKVLILGSTFNNQDPTGITLMNLFSNYPREKLLIACPTSMLSFESQHLIQNVGSVYGLGNQEYKNVFPLNLFKKDYPSGELKERIKKTINLNKTQTISKNVINLIVRFFRKRLGLDYFLSKVVISSKFDFWIKTNTPDIIYTLLSTRESIRFAKIISNNYGIPIVCHIMDDWLSLIGTEALFGKYLNKIINREFSEMLKLCDNRLAISEAMANEYKTRFGGEWDYFHNPIDLNFWNCLNSYKKDKVYNIVYSGRIGIGVDDSLIDIAKAVEKVSSDGINLKFIIQTKDSNNSLISRLKEWDCVEIRNYIEYENLPCFFRGADLLIIPYSFNKKSNIFIKLSMPTKVSEYMASNGCIIVYGPANTALYQHVQKNNWGVAVASQNHLVLAKRISELIKTQGDIDYYGNVARKYAENNYDIKIVTQKFINAINRN